MCAYFPEKEPTVHLLMAAASPGRLLASEAPGVRGPDDANDAHGHSTTWNGPGVVVKQGPGRGSVWPIFSMYGICMVYVWYIYGICMVYLWYIYGICMVYVWYIYGICMVYVWYIYLQNWAIFWANVGKYSSTMEHLGEGWRTRGLLLLHPKNEHRMKL